MKKYMFTLMLSFCSILSLSAMRYDEAREQARFLTDKMAYELNLNDQQYNDCYEINLDYLLGVETADDIYGAHLSYRNADLRHILYDWQYTIFCAADYFFRPLAWLHNRWFFPVYRHYHAGFYYYGLPTVYHSYRGGHGRFYHHGGFYENRRPHWNGGLRGADRHPMNHHGSIGRSTRGESKGYHIEHRGRQIEKGGAMDNRSGSSTHQTSYNHPSSTRTTVHAGSPVVGQHSTRGSRSTGIRSNGGTRGGGFGGSSRGGSFGGGSHSGSSHSGGSHGGSHGGFHGGGSHGGFHSGSHGGGSHGGFHSGSHGGSRGGGHH